MTALVHMPLQTHPLRAFPRSSGEAFRSCPAQLGGYSVGRSDGASASATGNDWTGKKVGPTS